MKFIFLIIIFLFLTNCSFDNKSGIWKNESTISNDQNEIFKEFEKISQLDSSFNKEIKFDKTFKFKISKPITNLQWTDNYFDETNNFENFKYNDLNQLILKSKKITKYKTSKHLFFINNNIIISDERGNINIFSLKKNKLIDKFNFYKKKYRKFKKKLNLVVKENIIYISDNIGYLYAYDLNKRKILWAKNFNVPFRSNIKVYSKRNRKKSKI
jgi:outer membrane protein assembly factor BamB